MARERNRQPAAPHPLTRIAPAQRALTVRQILEISGRVLDFAVIAGEAGLDNEVATSELNRPGLGLAGFLEVFSHDRIQIIGNTELSYLNSLQPGERRERLERICHFPIPCLVITSAYEIPPELLEVAGAHEIPVLKTSLHTSRFMSRMVAMLEQEFSPSMTAHGGLMDVFGMGVLLTGESGVGKSECALELIHRGHRLIADDVVILRRHSKTTIIGRSSPVTKYHMEVRGLGIINVEALFGAGAISDEKIVDLIIRLETWEPDKEYERLGIEEQACTIFDVDVPEYVIPVEPGRNLSVLIEVAAMNQRLKNTGFNPARSLDEQLIRKMQTEQAKPRKPKETSE